MKNNKTRSKFGGAAIIYLVVLLAIVLFYLGVPYSKLSSAINETNAKINTLRAEINLLNPYANQVAVLNEKSELAETQFAQNNELNEPVLFSNILYKCADNAGVSLTSVAINENAQVQLLETYTSKNLTAAVSITATDNAQVERFVKQLEENEGSAMLVQSLSYTAAEGTVVANATILMYTVDK